MEDALAFGGAVISLLNHADRVRCACLAQLVNVIAPIMTETGGPAWRQTIFYPFADMSTHGRGRVLRLQVNSSTYDASYYDPRNAQDLYYPVKGVPYLKAAAVAGEGGGLTLFILNRHMTEEMTLDVTARSFGALSLVDASELQDGDLQAVNSKAEPERIARKPLEGISVNGDTIALKLKPLSWNVVRLAER